MRYVRAAALFGVLGSLIFVAGCAGSSGGASPPIPLSDQSGDSPATGSTIGNPSTIQSTTTSGVLKHVNTATIFWGYSGTPTSVSLSRAAPWLTWAQTSPGYAGALRAAGIKVDVYVNFWRDYTVENPPIGYNDIKPGGAHSSAEAKLCTGKAIWDPTYGGGYEADARSSAAAGHAAVWGNYRKQQYGSNMDALFTDDVGAMSGIPLPCNWSLSSYVAATNRVTQSLVKPTFVNTINAGDPQDQVGYVKATNAIGAMCEICFAGYNRKLGKDVVTIGTRWGQLQNAAIAVVNLHKIFWDYPRPVGYANWEIPLRKYIYATFLLTYSPQYSMYQVAFKTNSGFPIMPETGVVPMNPVTTASTVSGYYRPGGAYMREFGACYYLAVYKSKCAVVVNPGSTTVTVPTTAYAHSLNLVGSGVLDGGYVTFTGGRVSSLPSGTGAILFP